MTPTPGPRTLPPTSAASNSTPAPAPERESAQLQAVLWDFDGTLADSEHLWMEAQYELIPTLGGEWSDEHAGNLVGNSLIDSGRYIVSVLGRDDLSPQWVVDELTRRVIGKLRAAPIPWRPGALELLAALKAEGIPSALVSASFREMLDTVVDRLPEGSFATVVAGDEVTHGKPDPEPYLTAARQLGADPSRCIVLEDSNPGSTSGNAAGALVLAIHNVVTVADAPRRVHLDTLAGIDPDALRRLLNDNPPVTGLDGRSA